MKRQPRVKAMLPAIKEYIARRATEDLTTGRQTMAAELVNEIRKTWPSQIPPTEQTLARRISQVRNRAANPLDVAWHMGLLSTHALTAGAVAAILKCQALAGKHRSHPVTVRQALWVAVLSEAVRDLHELWAVAYIYAHAELVSELAGIPFDTTDMDAVLGSGGNLCLSRNTLGGETMAQAKQGKRPKAIDILEDPSVHDFTKRIVREALLKDPVDAIADVQLALDTITRNWEEVIR